ncbi:MAG TPA: carbon monoxide dehydrogenase subunit G [Thermoanaerobaculia bacterium]|nr:carbon monoxide dehydrogenase subunit G [Thermoanaerobaculia bacterium]
MHFEGIVSIKASRQKVWDFLTDPHKVSGCAPGLEKLEIVEPGQKFRATTSIGFGSVKVKFVNDVEWLEMDAPNLARMKAHGTAPGSGVDAESAMRLTDGQEGGTDLAWSADVTVVGTIASLAARLMGGVTKKLTAAFFDSVKEAIEARA